MTEHEKPLECETHHNANGEAIQNQFFRYHFDQLVVEKTVPRNC